MNISLRKIGIQNDSYELFTVADLIKDKIIEKPLDGNHGEIHPKGNDFVDFGVPFIMASDINNGQVDYEKCKFISEKQASELRKGFAKNGDILLTHKASIGRTGVVNYTLHPYVMLTPQVTYYRIINKQKLNNRYLRYYFDCDYFQKIMKMWAGAGSTRAYLGITAQHKLPIIVPKIDIQNKVAAILCTYDDLIENNKRRIALLENFAEEIYREWFVRFRFPGYKSTEFKKGIPAEWSIESIKNIVDRKRFGKTYKPVDLENEGSIIVIDQSRNEYLGFYNGEPEHKATYENPMILFGDHTCKMVLMHKDFSLAENVIPFCPIEKMPVHFLFHLIKEKSKQTEYKRHWSELTTQNVLIPSFQLQSQFSLQVIDIYRMIENLKSEISNLVSLRDMLLTRLISGKLSVEDLDIQFPPSMQEENLA